MEKGFIVIGDTHGNFEHIKWYIKHNKITDAVMFHVGDFGIGFTSLTNDVKILTLLNDFLTEKGIHLYVIRGNHDAPSFFNGKFDYSNLHLLPDYTVIDINGENVLMVGGAISVDRVPRIADDYKNEIANINKRKYWVEEKFVLDEDKLKECVGIDYVITHTAPSFVAPFNSTTNVLMSHGPLVEHFANNDPKLKDDLNAERAAVDRMYDILVEANTIKKWFYGHFHNHNAMYHDETDFIMLDINEFYTVRQDEGYS